MATTTEVMMSLFPSATKRVEKNTPEALNVQIEEDAIRDVVKMVAQGPDAISRRIEELDREWDIERALEANAATASLIGLALAAKFGRRWLVLPMAVAGFLLQHALQGWCPPVPIMRKLGFRTATEINAEKTALRILRGDFGMLMDSPIDAFRMAGDGSSANPS
jgi:hypothetical protein